MTIPSERYRALLWGKELIESLCSSSQTPRVPKHIREQAHRVLRHYPSEWEFQKMADACPDLLDKECVSAKFTSKP